MQEEVYKGLNDSQYVSALAASQPSGYFILCNRYAPKDLWQLRKSAHKFQQWHKDCHASIFKNPFEPETALL